MRHRLILALALASFAVGAHSQDGGEATAAQTPAPEMKPEAKKVCFVRNMIGSNLPRKVCRTAEQLRKERKRNAGTIDPAIVTSVQEPGEAPGPN